MTTDHGNYHEAKVAAMAQRRVSKRAFGQATPVSGAHSTPTVFVPHLPVNIPAFNGKVHFNSGGVTRERQVGQPPVGVTRLLNTTTKEERDVGPNDAQTLMRQGWVPIGRVNAPPAANKQPGKL